MSSNAPSGAPLPGPRAEATIGDLLGLIWAGVLANKKLIIVILLVGVASAFLQKAPFLMLAPLMQATVGEGANAASSLAWLNDGIVGFGEWFRDLIGFDIAAPTVDPKGNSLSLEQIAQKEIAISVCLGAGVMAAIAGIGAAVAIYFTLVLTRYFATKIVVDLRNQIGAHLVRLPLRFYGERRMGDLLSSLTNDTQVISRSFTLACDHVVMDPLLVMFNAGLILVALPEAVWVLLLMLPIMALPLIRLGRKIQKRSSRSLAAMGDATESMNQMLSGIKTVKAFQLEDRKLQDFRDNNDLYLRRTKRMLQSKASSNAWTTAAYTLGFAVMVFGMGWLLLTGSAGLDQMALVGVGLGTTYQHVKRLARAYNTLMESVGALEGIKGVLEQEADDPDAGETLDRVRGEVAFEGVGFAYGSEPVLRDVNFRVEPGQVVALVGPSGAGKSTAVDLLARFHDPTDGRVCVDGHDLRDVSLGSFRRHIAMVTQQPFLFNATILENIRYGKPDASMAEIVAAAKAAQIHDFIETLPEGYDSPAGERGCNLSGGQMQRIAIARAILRDPRILLLDEATSALDSESEGAVQQALNFLMQGRTSFVIAHRLSTIRDADKILVLEEGRLVEQGSHQELVAREGLYARLVRLQQVG